MLSAKPLNPILENTTAGLYTPNTATEANKTKPTCIALLPAPAAAAEEKHSSKHFT